MLIIICGILILALISFLIYRNMKDEKKFEKDKNEEDEHPLRPPTEEEKRI